MFSSSQDSTYEGKHKIHVSKQQRTSRKCVVTIAGMDDDLDLDRIAKVIRKTFHCNAAVVNKRDYEEIVEANEAKRREGGYLSLDDMIVKQTTPGKRMKFSRPMLHLDSGKVIILQGDYREGVIKLFKDAEIVLDESRLMIHG